MLSQPPTLRFLASREICVNRELTMAGTIYLVGEAMGQAMLELLKSKQETEPSVRQPMHVAAARQPKTHTTSKTKKV